MRPWLLSELNYGHVKAHPLPEVAVLPLGATEPHNLHLPYGTDVFEGTIVGEKICEEAHRRGAELRGAGRAPGFAGRLRPASRPRMARIHRSVR